MKARDISRSSGRRTGLVVATSAVAILASLLGGTARGATDGMAGLCPPAGALMSYVSGGSMSTKAIVVQRDGRVWVCWAGRAGSGRMGFVLSKTELTALRAQLSQARVRHQQTTQAAAAMHRAELMIDIAAEQRIAGGVPSTSGAAAELRAALMIDATAERLIAGE